MRKLVIFFLLWYHIYKPIKAIQGGGRTGQIFEFAGSRFQREADAKACKAARNCLSDAE